MQASIVIVSKNRKEELEKTLMILEKLIDFSNHEVLVFLDGCSDGSELLKNQFKWVMWDGSEKSIGASGARNALYPKAKGEYLIGLDDDAHPLQTNFIDLTKTIFRKYNNVGIVAFQEIKGVFDSDVEALRKGALPEQEYLTNDFIGCGFAIRKDVYQATKGFPVWIDIYGEESCLSIEVMAKGNDILYTNTIKVNHRVNITERKLAGQNYFRFGKQLKNSTYYYLVYYPFPVLKIVRLLWHNFRKYALTDLTFFKIFFKTIFEVLLNGPKILKYRNPVDKKILVKMRKLKALQF
jgi:GT2 family glycosyltransferase